MIPKVINIVETCITIIQELHENFIRPHIVNSALIFANAQCVTPPLAGIDYIFAVDVDNDGFAPFDIGYYIEF